MNIPKTPENPSSRYRPVRAATLALLALALAGANLRVGPDRPGVRPESTRSTSARRPSSRSHEEPTAPPAGEPAPAAKRRAPPTPLPKPPVRPAPAPRPDPSALRVSEIVFDPSDSEATFAVVDGRAVRAGDTVAGWPVVAVSRTSVRIGEVELLREPKESR